MSMPKYLPLTCAQCRRTLRVRAAYLGQMVTCNHCDHPFLATELPAGRSASSSGESSAIGAAQAPATRPAESWETGTRPEVKRLQDQIAALRQRLEWAEGAEEELESARKENGRLETTLQVLKTELFERVTEVDRLQRCAEDLIAVRAERDQCDRDLRAAREEAEQLEARLKDALQAHRELEDQHESVCLEHGRQYQDALRLWESQRHELVARAEQELRNSREEATRQREEDSRAAQARERLSHDQLDAAHRKFEEERQVFRSRTDSLESDLAGLRAERDQVVGQVARLQAELDRCAKRESQWERSLGENECRHRTEIDGLAHELRIASTQAGLAVQREHALTEQLQIAQRELDDLRQQLAVTGTERDRLAQERAEAELGLRSIHNQHRDQLDSLQYDLQEARRWEEIAIERETELLGQIQDLRGTLDLYEQKLEDQRRTHQEESRALAHELEAMFRQQMAELQEQLEVLKQQRDVATEQAGMLRLDRDRLYGSLARLEARVQEVEEENRTANPQRASEAADGQHALEAATHREVELRTQLDSLETQVDPQGTGEPALPLQPLETDGWPFSNQPAPSADPIVAAGAATDPRPEDSPGPENADPMPVERALDSPIGRDPETALETDSDTDRIARPEPLADESPEARILHLRKSLRVAHEARAKGPLSGPFFTRLARIWKRNRSAQ